MIWCKKQVFCALLFIKTALSSLTIKPTKILFGLNKQPSFFFYDSSHEETSSHLPSSYQAKLILFPI